MSRVKESELSRTMRSWPQYERGLIDFIEPGRGSDVGLPDCMLTLAGRMVPLELKRGKSVVSELRPSQRAWHRLKLHHGMRTYGLTVLRDRRVALFQLALAGGLMSELQEMLLAEWQSLEALDYARLADNLSA